MANKKYDAIIIGAGIIGNCIAFEMAKKGFKTLSVEKLSGSGFGSTAASCAIVRAHYSTQDGVAMAYEGFKIWDKWGEYLEIDDPDGLAQFRKTGSILLKSQGHKWQDVQGHYDAVGVDYEEWSTEKVEEMVPVYDLHEFWPPTRPDEDENFMDHSGKKLEGAIFCPGGGYMSDPRLSSHNAEVAARAKGAEFMFKAEVTAVRSENNRVQGITLMDGTEIDAPIVVNVAGPHSFIINQLAGVYDTQNIKTKALRHEVAFAPSPEGFNFEKDGYHTSDGDNSIYMRPEVGNSILIGSEDPDCDPQEWVDPDEFNRNVTDAQWKAQVYRAARRVKDLPITDKKRGVVDLYDCSDDWIPIYDRSSLDGFYQAIGSSGNQYKNAPVAGMMMAELIDRIENHGLDHDNEPFQFTLPRCGISIDVGFYSRNREINYNSSFSVNG